MCHLNAYTRSKTLFMYLCFASIGVSFTNRIKNRPLTFIWPQTHKKVNPALLVSVTYFIVAYIIKALAYLHAQEVTSYSLNHFPCVEFISQRFD